MAFLYNMTYHVAFFTSVPQNICLLNLSRSYNKNFWILLKFWAIPNNREIYVFISVVATPVF